MRIVALLPFWFGCAVGAQSIEFYPEYSTYTSRGALGDDSGEVAQGFHQSHWRAIGSVGGHAALAGARYVLQDQDAATQSVYHVVIRRGADATGPTVGNAGLLCVVGPLMLPLGSGTIAFRVTTSFRQPCLLANEAFVSAGLVFGPSPSWPVDGLSVHMNLAEAQSGPQRQDHAWNLVAGASAFTHPPLRLAWRIALLTNTPVLQNGVFATGTRAFSRGIGGMFPPLATHGWSTHVDGGLPFAAGVARVFLTTNPLSQPIVLPFLEGAVYLPPDAVGVATLFLDAEGRADLPIVDPVPRLGIHCWVQAVLIDNSLSRFATTNSHAATFQ